ncbi:MAG: endonuclease MutS2 [Acetivibrionales bacterium]|jgi:DNA mismatch repair protein MutS2
MDNRVLKTLEFNKIAEKLVELSSSELGKEISASITPQQDYCTVKDLLKETSDALDFIVKKGSPPLGGIHDIRSSIKRVEMGAVLSPAELLKIADLLRAARRFRNYARGAQSSREALLDEENIVYGMAGSLEGNRAIEDKIYFSILGEEEIADDASSTLRSIRRKIKDIQESIKDKLNGVIKSARYQKFIQEPIVTMRGDRYVIPVKQEYRNEIKGLVHDSSSSGATIFIEPMAVVEANNDIKQLRIKEQAEIERILQELTCDVNGILTSLKTNVSILARLDFIFAKARLSLKYDCVCPVINNNQHIRIKKGRHPLLDRDTVVPIDFWIGEGFNTMVITGPNTGGKTVTLKTVGLFTLMTQAGLHIPANDGTEMGIYNSVFADIGDEQSIEQSLSTFSSHMVNIVNILKKADERSLVLFDELGAGTDPTEGAALAMSILECLRERGTSTVATTHYSELKIYAVSTEGVENASCEFDVKTLKPTYRLLIGTPGKSNAFAISHRLGLDEEILERARTFLSKEDIQFEDVLVTIEKNRSEAEQEKIRAESYRIEIERLKKELEGEKQKFDRQKERIIKEAKQEARKILLETKREADTILSEIKRLEEEQISAEKNRTAEEMKMRLRNKINELEESMVEPLMPKKGYIKPPEGLKPGDSVLIVNLNQKGTVITPPGKDGEAVIQAGIMKINVHVTNLKLIDEQKKEIDRVSTGRTAMSKTRKVSTEIDLRGTTIEEALDYVDKFLDDASISGLNEAIIIHGKGTGALRSGIHRFLKSHAHVKSYRLGKYGEGETGVTIVEIK